MLFLFLSLMTLGTSSLVFSMEIRPTGHVVDRALDLFHNYSRGDLDVVRRGNLVYIQPTDIGELKKDKTITGAELISSFFYASGPQYCSAVKQSQNKKVVLTVQEYKSVKQELKNQEIKINF